MFGRSREHLGSILKEKIFKKSFQWKSCFCVKSVWFDNKKFWFFGKFQQSRSNVSRIFEEHSTNVCFKNIPRITPQYCKVTKIFLKVKKFKKLFCGLSCEDLNIEILMQTPLLQYFSELYWNCFTIRVIFWKGSYRFLTAGKNFKIAQHYYNHYKYFPSVI